MTAYSGSSRFAFSLPIATGTRNGSAANASSANASGRRRKTTVSTPSATSPATAAAAASAPCPDTPSETACALSATSAPAARASDATIATARARGSRSTRTAAAPSAAAVRAAACAPVATASTIVMTGGRLQTATYDLAASMGASMTLKAALIPALLLVAALAPAAVAAPPSNDPPTAAGAFEVYSAVNGIPTERQAIAELAEATPDPGVVPCLGSDSFLRTVWYRIPSTQTPRELTIEASGRTLGVVDLAAFVQAGPGQTITKLPNMCAGAGVGGGDSAGDATPA